MILEEIRNIKETPRDLRKFGITIGIVMLIICAFLFWKKKPSAEWFLVIAAFFILCGIVFPLILRPFNKIWITISILLGFVMTRVILSLLFFLVLTPIAFIAKLSGKRFLDLKRDSNIQSYWIKRDIITSSEENYETQF